MLGASAVKDWGPFYTTLGVSNGSGTNALNENNKFSTIFQIASRQVKDGLQIAATIMQSDDRADQVSIYSNSNHSQLSVELLELVAKTGTSTLNFHLGRLNYNDFNDTTTDYVNIFGAEYGIDNGNVFAGARVSYWRPQDMDGNGTGISGSVVSPGLIQGRSNDLQIIRSQYVLGSRVDENVVVKVELVNDDYHLGTDETMLNTTLNVVF